MLKNRVNDPSATSVSTATSGYVKYAIERSLLPGVANGYAQTYFRGVVGFDDAIEQAQSDPSGGAPDISGITTPDDTTLVIDLIDTSSIGVMGALSLPVSGPVPEEYANSPTPTTRLPTASTRCPAART